MKKYTFLSIGGMLLGVVMLVVKGFMHRNMEMVNLLGILLIVIGGLASFFAIVKQEPGIGKYGALVSFFLVLLFLTLVDPFQFVRILTWLKNW